jgi:predicted nucleic acid-binding protein
LSACVLDTDVVIAALDRRDAHHLAAAELLEWHSGAGSELLLSAVNYAEALVRPAEDERTLRAAVDAIARLGVRIIPPDAKIAAAAARNRGLGISFADGFALATATAHRAAVASFDKRVQRALASLDLQLSEPLKG